MTAAEPYDAVDVIAAKRDGGELTDGQVGWVIDAYTRGAVADYQMSALLMAVLLRGLSARELATWTASMIGTGERLDLGGPAGLGGRPTVDKHSTGGVGDTVSLILAPLVAACGAAVPQLSGRGLGHTGGTLDKMEAIPGWSPRLDPAALREQLRDVGAVIAAAGETLVPADRLLYALRDVTATVESIPLIASSIMSKKIAEGTSALVLDVTVGSGAFMKTREAADELARTMVDLGTAAGVATTALLTDMSTPRGRACGNALEVDEAEQVFAGGGPADLVEVTLALAREMLALVGRDGIDPADALADGRAADVWRRMVAAQGGDLDAPRSPARVVETWPAPVSGTLQRLDAYAVGVAAWRLGAGRARKEDPVSPAAGIICLAVQGDEVVAGQPLLALHTDEEARLPRAFDALDGAVDIAAGAARPRRTVLGRITA